VQGVERQDRKLLDAAALVGHLVPEDSVFALLATHRPVPRLLALARRSATVGCAVVGHAIGRTSLPRHRS
jgi:hypothetical protein